MFAYNAVFPTKPYGILYLSLILKVCPSEHVLSYLYMWNILKELTHLCLEEILDKCHMIFFLNNFEIAHKHVMKLFWNYLWFMSWIVFDVPLSNISPDIPYPERFQQKCSSF